LLISNYLFSLPEAGLMKRHIDHRRCKYWGNAEALSGQAIDLLGRKNVVFLLYGQVIAARLALQKRFPLSRESSTSHSTRSKAGAATVAYRRGP
jgi:hypothetical protein